MNTISPCEPFLPADAPHHQSCMCKTAGIFQLPQASTAIEWVSIVSAHVHCFVHREENHNQMRQGLELDGVRDISSGAWC
jgi:hypothetical protein